MSINSTSKRAMRRALLTVTLVLGGLAIVSSAALAGTHHRRHHAQYSSGPKPTIVLVHGAWANTASWDGVIERLEAEGYTVETLRIETLARWESTDPVPTMVIHLRR